MSKLGFQISDGQPPRQILVKNSTPFNSEGDTIHPALSHRIVYCIKEVMQYKKRQRPRRVPRVAY
jgi:hypothetical protein